MQYLVDSNVLITANARYYEIGRIPQFWDWLARKARADIVKSPVEILREITPNVKDQQFFEWMDSNRANLALPEEHLEKLVLHVLERGYGFKSSEFVDGIPVENTNDAVLIAYALADKGSRSVVTLEGVQIIGESLPAPENRTIPLVCNLLNIPFMNTFELIRKLDFRIPKSIKY